MKKRILFAVVLGAVAFALLGALIYEFLLGGFYESNLGSAIGVVREVPVVWALVLSQLGLAGLLTFVFVQAGVSSAGGGLKLGATFGILFGIALAFDLYAITNWYNLTVAIAEPFLTVVRMSLAGAVIGWALGR